MKTIMNPKARMLTAIAISALLVAGCTKKDKVEDLPPAAEDPGTVVTDPGPTEGQIIPGSQADFLQSVGMGGDRVFFDTDRYNIDAQDQATLQTQAQWLARYPNTRITIGGHADERGTREYNLALGERRANAAKNYLTSVGVDAGRIQTVSYGKEQPQALGSDEAAWAQNRRAVTIVIE